MRWAKYIARPRAWRLGTITSQLPLAKWHDVIGEPTFADAILDRIVHNAHRLELDGPSMRKIKADKNGPATIDQAQGK